MQRSARLPGLPRRAGARRRGQALVLAVLAVFVVALAAAVAPLRPAADRAQRQAQLDAGRAAVLDWYAGRLAALDGAAGFPHPPAEVLRAAGLDPRGPLRFAAGPLVDAGTIRFRHLLLWWPPGPDDATGFDPVDGSPRPDPRAAALAFSSRPLQVAALARTEAALRELALRAERRFAAKVDADAGHGAGRNWFHAPDGRCRLDTDQIPCASALSPTGWATVAELRDRSLAFGRGEGAGLPLVDGWGGALRWSNEADPQWLQPPYRMAFAARTPWDTVAEVQAVQPQ